MNVRKYCYLFKLSLICDAENKSAAAFVKYCGCFQYLLCRLSRYAKVIKTMFIYRTNWKHNMMADTAINIRTFGNFPAISDF